MQPEDLRKEITDKRLSIAKMSIEVEMRSEKDTARFLREKKELARLLTIQHEKMRSEKSVKPALKTSAKTSKVSAPAPRSSKKSAVGSASTSTAK